MADGLKIEVKGLNEVRQQLINLGSVAGTKAMRQAMFAATKPLLARARQNTGIFSRSGALQKSLRRVFLAERFGFAAFGDNGSTFTISLGPKRRDRTAVTLYNLVYKPKHPRRGIYYGHFLEWGTKRGVHPWHWLEGALKSTAQQCVSLLGSETQKRIDKCLRTKRPVND